MKLIHRRERTVPVLVQICFEAPDLIRASHVFRVTRIWEIVRVQPYARRILEMAATGVSWSGFPTGQDGWSCSPIPG